MTKSSRIVHFQLILLIILAKSSIFQGFSFWRLFFLESLTDYFRSRTPLAEGLAAWFDLDLSHLGPNCNLDPIIIFGVAHTPTQAPHKPIWLVSLCHTLFFFSPKGLWPPFQGGHTGGARRTPPVTLRYEHPLGGAHTGPPRGPVTLRNVTSGSFSFS